MSSLLNLTRSVYLVTVATVLIVLIRHDQDPLGTSPVPFTTYRGVLGKHLVTIWTVEDF
jgi:hypothetical protein